MIFDKGTAIYAYEVRNESGQNVAYVNYMGAPYIPYIASSPEVMGRTVDMLIESPNVSRIVFVQQRNYSYDLKCVALLTELAYIYNYLIKKEKILLTEKLGTDKILVAQRYDFLNTFLQTLKTDPFAAYQKVKVSLLEEKVISTKNKDYKEIIYRLLLEKIVLMLEESKLIKNILDLNKEGSNKGREVYSKIFVPEVIPNFAFARLVSSLPEDSKIISQYEIGDGDDKSIVTILKKINELKYFYHLMPPEYFLNEDHQMLLNLARNVLLEHQPRAEEFVDPSRTRQIFFNVARDLLRELSESKKIEISYPELNKLAKVLVRHTIGFGLLEVLLQDNKLQDIVLNAPISLNPIYLRHEKYDECVTNIMLSQEDADSWAAKFRMVSGRPLDEANPILDTDLLVDNIRARIAVVQRPLSLHGISYAVRRHRDYPWTLPLFIHNKMINSFGAGLMSFLIDGSRTLLIAGTRSSGKTSLLGSLMLEIKPKYRMILVEDTPELPFEYLRKLGYDILSMKVRSSLTETSNELSAEEGIRTSLRLGDSSLIVGEIRSNEAKALYEAMRVGALANVVAGTVHGSSPYSVFDRIVNDLNVPVTSFKATDLILVANPVKTPDGMHSYKRVIQLTEVRKHWTKDPLEEGGFIDLMRYNVEKDELEPTDELMNGDSEVIKTIAASVKGWVGNWDAVYDNILLRGKIKQEIVNISEKLKRPELMEAKFCAIANNVFHEVSDEIANEIGIPHSERVFPLWVKRIDEEIRKFEK
ncbi:MAG TPA: type II/IV secretion system ATPase subunit [Candidatus Paceibacterota bacterium]|nr:type II/IV secretion system ATPase subunit [Candidatus Paceibacterota bacterium]